MANLLKCWPVLTRKERRTITFALRNHPPSSKYLINNGEWLAAADNPNQGFLDRQVAITALHHINGVYGTAAGDAPDFVEVGEAGIAVGDAMRRERRVQLVG